MKTMAIYENDLRMEFKNVQEKCRDILRECKKWEQHPEAVFEHGYALEKATKMVDAIQSTRKQLRDGGIIKGRGD